MIRMRAVSELFKGSWGYKHNLRPLIFSRWRQEGVLFSPPIRLCSELVGCSNEQMQCSEEEPEKAETESYRLHVEEDILSNMSASRRDVGYLATAEMVFPQCDEIVAPISSQRRWKSKGENDVHSNDTVQTGALSKRLHNLSSHAPVVPALEKWLVEGYALTKNVVIVALSNLKRQGRYKQAFEVADFIWRERIYAMDDVDHMYRLYLVGQSGSVEDVEKCFATIPSKWLTEKVYNQLISCYIARDMLPHAMNALERLKNSGQTISALPFNQFMALYRHQRQVGKALELMKEMNLSDVSPDTRTYNLLLSTISKNGDPDGVLRQYKTMKDEGIVPNVLTFSLVGKAYILAGRLKEAEELAIKMQSMSLKNSHLAQDLLLAVYAQQNRPEELKRTWKQIGKSSKLSARSYGVMIESLGKLGLVEEAQKLAYRAEKVKRKLPARVYNAMMDVYGRHGMMEEAERLLTRIQKEGFKANCVTYKHLVAGYLKIGQLGKAAEYLKASRQILKSEYSNPWFMSFLLFLNHLADKGKVEVIERTFSYFTAPNKYRNTAVYNALLKAYVKAGIKAPNFLQRMSSDGIHPDAMTLALLSEADSLQEPC